MSVLTSGEFWAFVGVMAGIYTLFTLGLQVQFGLAGLLNFGQVGFMAIGAYTMAILVAKEGWSMWVATPLAIAAAALAGVLVGLPTLRLPRRLLRDRHHRLQRDRALGGDQRGRADGRRPGNDQPRGPGKGRPVQRAVGAVPALRSAPNSTSATRTWSCSSSYRPRRSSSSGSPPARADAVGQGAPRHPRGRGRDLVARQARLRLPPAGAGARGGDGGPRRLCLRVAVLLLQPRRLPTADHVLRLDDPHPRRGRPRLGGPGRGVGVRVPVRRDALLRLRSPSRTWTRPTARTSG